MLRREDIPRLAERLAVHRLYQAFDLARRYGFSNRMQEWIILRAVWAAHLKGHGLTLLEVTRATAMKRPTVLRKLRVLVKERILERDGERYWVSADYLLGTTAPGGLLDRLIGLIKGAARELEDIERESKMDSGKSFGAEET
jgi:predicted DNA-binding transcriptional regulator